jgi:hypothetical protein
MGELQERLRAHFRNPTCQKAADELDRLTAENARLRAKLSLTPENVERVANALIDAEHGPPSYLATAAIKALGDE